MADSVDTDQMPHSVASDLDLHSLPRPSCQNTWVNTVGSLYVCLWFFCFLLQIDTDYTEETYSISNYPLSAALTCAKLCNAFEEKWGIV